MRLSPSVVKVLSFLLAMVAWQFGLAFAQGYSPTSDLGVIQEITGDRVYIQGRLGDYIFEMLNTCNWCERSIDVIIAFESFSRASIRPDPNPLNMSSVQLFIMKDARDNL